MADQRMIGDVLSERRRSLGLSIDRVVEDTKLQRRMVEAFEDSDFDAMPPRGYAQASLASYARYLGLNSKEILRDYEDQLYDYQRDMGMDARPGARGRRVASSEASRERATRPSGSTRASRGGQYDEGASYGRAASRSARGDDGHDFRERSSSRSGGVEGGRHSADSPRRSAPSFSSYDRSEAGRARERGLYGADSPRRAAAASPRRDDPYAGAQAYGPARSERARAGAPARGGEVRDAARVSRAAGASERGASRALEQEGRPSRATGRGGASGARRADERQQPRRGTQVVDLDDGYEGGSGGDHDDEHYRSRAQRRGAAAQRQSLAEVLQGFLDSIHSDRRTFVIVVSAIAATLVIVLAVTISSCVRSSTSTNPDGSNNIPVTTVNSDGTAATTLAPSIDLNSVPTNSTFALNVAADAVTAPWIEVYVDGTPVFAQTTEAGTSLQWTFTRSLTVNLSSTDSVTLAVNGVTVTPTPNNGSFTLSASVPEDQWPADTAAADDGSIDSADSSDDGVPDDTGDAGEGEY